MLNNNGLYGNFERDKVELHIAFEYNIYAYDAYFLQCAKQFSSPIISLDKRMKEVAYDLKIEIVG